MSSSIMYKLSERLFKYQNCIITNLFIHNKEKHLLLVTKRNTYFWLQRETPTSGYKEKHLLLVTKRNTYFWLQRETLTSGYNNKCSHSKNRVLKENAD